MTTYNTGNPIGSTAVKDLYDNAENFDDAVNGSAQNWIDRLGRSRRSLAGFEVSALAVLAAAGYMVPVPYTGGLQMDTANQTVSYNGDTYAPIQSELPFVTSGTFETSRFRLIQGVSGPDLATASGGEMVGLNVGVGSSVDRTIAGKAADDVTTRDYLDLDDAVQSAANTGLNIIAPETITSSIHVPGNRFFIDGRNQASALDYTGGTVDSVIQIDNAGDGSAAYLNSRLSNLVLTCNGASFNRGALDVVYLSRNSVLSDIDISSVGGGAGVRVSKAWYLSMDRVRVVNPLAHGRGVGTVGVHYDATGQINDVLNTKVSVNRLETGILIDQGTGQSINGLTFVLPTIEQCQYGFRRINGGELTRMQIYGAYFEGNDWDIYWPDDGANLISQASWYQPFFALSSGKLYLARGTHTFYGAYGIKEITVGPNARVTILGNSGVAPAVTYLPGADSRNYRIATVEGASPEALLYAGTFTIPDVAASARIIGATVDNAAMPIPPELLPVNVPATGRALAVDVCFRRVGYSPESSLIYRYVLSQNSSTGPWGIAISGGTTPPPVITITVDAVTGTLYFTWTAGDTKVIDVKFSPF